ncbi:unnamed protein product [Camellia sinensis]
MMTTIRARHIVDLERVVPFKPISAFDQTLCYSSNVLCNNKEMEMGELVAESPWTKPLEFIEWEGGLGKEDGEVLFQSGASVFFWVEFD